jgi:hypothetical protein
MMNANETNIPLSQSKVPDYGGTALKGDSQHADDDFDSSENESCIFPFEPFRCCPCMGALLPLTWTRIVSLPHLVVLVASFSSALVFIEDIMYWKTTGCRTTYCEGRIIPAVFVAVCAFYFFKVLQQYDYRLVQKQKVLQTAKREFSARCKYTIQDLEGWLARSLETQVTFAENGFDSARKDFIRFLQKYTEMNHVEVYRDGSCDSLPAFRSFVQRWLGYFSEASIDPVCRPLLVLTLEDLNSCNDRNELATVVSARLKSVEVQFVSNQREKDKAQISSVRTKWASMSAAQQKALKYKEAICGYIPSLHHKEKADNTPDLENSVALSFDNTSKESSGAKDDYRWVQWACSRRPGAIRDSDENINGRLPAQLNLCCVTIVFLSTEHIQLMIAFFLGIAVLVWEIEVVPGYQYDIIIETCVCLLCIMYILYDFLDIDIIQQLDTQLRELEAAQLEVLQKRERIVTFYQTADELVDLWLHHTLAHLDLMKSLYEGLLDLPVEEHIEVINGLEQHLQAIDQNLPPLEQWRGDSVVSVSKKKAFSGTIREFVNKNNTIKEAMAALPQCHYDMCKALGVDTPALPALPGATETARPGAKVSTYIDRARRSQLNVDKKPQPYTAGSSVEYFSKSRWRWIPAQVLRVDPSTGFLDLDYKNDVDPKNVRHIRPEGEEEESKCSQQ